MLKIRLRRMGAIRQPHYRIVVADARAPRDGRFFEILGHYNPRTEPATIQVDVAKYEEWKSKGAQPTEAVVRLVTQFTKGNMADTTQPAAGKTRNASRAGIQPAPAPAAAESAPLSEGAAEATRDSGEGSEAITGGADASAETTAVDNTDAPLLNADAGTPAGTPAGAPEGAADTDTAS